MAKPMSKPSNKAHPKRKVLAHVIDTEAIRILKGLLPSYWTIREYVPDYGIDLAIEAFAPVDTTGAVAKYDTLGEHVFAQVKGTKATVAREISVPWRYNIEKSCPKGHHPPGMDEVKQCTIVDFQIDTSELVTVQRMGAALPVVLFVVNTGTDDVFFVCLNDYIDKILLPSDPEYAEKASKVLHLPTRNCVTSDAGSLDPIKFFAKRPKLYALFQKLLYQDRELGYVADEYLVEHCTHFAKILLQMDVWQSAQGWFALHILYRQLQHFVSTGLVQDITVSESLKNKVFYERDPVEWDDPEPPHSITDWLQRSQLRSLWSNLSNLGRVFEETCREWYLPTTFGVDCIQWRNRSNKGVARRRGKPRA